METQRLLDLKSKANPLTFLWDTSMAVCAVCGNLLGQLKISPEKEEIFGSSSVY